MTEQCKIPEKELKDLNNHAGNYFDGLEKITQEYGINSTMNYIAEIIKGSLIVMEKKAPPNYYITWLNHLETFVKINKEIENESK